MTETLRIERRRTRLVASIVGAILIIAILILAIFFPCPTSSQYIFFRMTLSIALAGLAATIPGFITIKYKNIVSAGGAIGVFVFSWLFNPALIVISDKCNEPFDFTIFVEDSKGFTPLKNTGKIVLFVEHDRREEFIDSKGSVTFRQIPDKLFHETVRVQLEADGWLLENDKGIDEIKLEGKSFSLIIKRDNSLCCVSGSVRDSDNNFLSGVKVRIADITVRTSETGRFNIEIPHGNQKEEQNLTAYKEGFIIWEDMVYPATKKDVSIILIKK